MAVLGNPDMLTRKIKLCHINAHITCRLCEGYLIDATTVTECLHTFCRSCLVKYLEENNTCPTCRIVIHQSHPLQYIGHDRTMQDIVYKLVPGLQEAELKKQREFYQKLGMEVPGDIKGELSQPTPPTPHHPPDTAHPAQPTRHSPTDTTHPAQPNRHHPPDTTHPAQPNRHHPPDTTHPAQPNRHHPPGTAHPTPPTRHHPPGTALPTPPTPHHPPDTTTRQHHNTTTHHPTPPFRQHPPTRTAHPAQPTRHHPPYTTHPTQPHTTRHRPTGTAHPTPSTQRHPDTTDPTQPYTTQPTPPIRHHPPNTPTTPPTRHHHPPDTTPTPPTRHHPNTTHQTTPTQTHHPDDTAHQTPPRHHPPDTTHPTPPTRYHPPNHPTQPHTTHPTPRHRPPNTTQPHIQHNHTPPSRRSSWYLHVASSDYSVCLSTGEAKCDEPGHKEAGEEKAEEDNDYHRSDEQVSICLECNSSKLRGLKRKWIRCSAQATVLHLKKFIAKKLNLTSFNELDILCNEEILGKDHTLKFVVVTRWRFKKSPLLLHYRPKMDLL
ncbi:hypothetical protein WMY93_009128 [Mugilogobius chulae]|uniref:Polycomb group RING finger protein 3 n=3 Tax=Percomorphaceae TaxID=1489872 RepID=A0AAW0PAI9_9GOBI